VKAKRVIGGIALFSLLMTGFVISFTAVKTHRDALPAESQRAEALMVSPTLLKVVSGEFKGLWADYLLMKASVFIGGAWEITPEDLEAVYLLFKQSLALDPYFFQTYYYTQGFLSWRKGWHAKAVELLKISEQHRPWDWEPGFFIGFDLFYYLKKNKEAAEYMQTSAQRPGAPPVVATLGARLAQKTGQNEMAIALLRSMHERMDNQEQNEHIEKRIQAHLGIRQLEQAMAHYENRYGEKPARLDQLVTAGIIALLPENPYGDSFFYDPETDELSFDRIQ